MEIEKKLQILQDLREQSNINRNRISRTEIKEGKKKRRILSEFSIRLLVSVLLFLGILLADQSSDRNVQKVVREIFQEISVNQMENQIWKLQYHD